MSGVRRALGWTWAAPLTLLGLCLVGVVASLGWCSSVGRREDALVWLVAPSCPSWLRRWWWLHEDAHALGNVVVTGVDPDNHLGRVVLRHQQARVGQMMRLGVLYPLAWATVWLIIRWTCVHSMARYTHPFAVDARRAAGQLIDVEGAVKIAARSVKRP